MLFCGAGVSRAYASLPDFFGLAERVIALEGNAESEAKKLLDLAREVQSRLNVGGIIAADAVFGLLERKFEARDIQQAVATALRPDPAVDLTAHRILLDLATGPDAKVHLVTTNFDLLFEACKQGLHSWAPPKLPDPERYEEMEGIIHLHGRVNADYSGAHGDGFVLSSSEFGRAYISQAWATDFISSILKKYVVVFVGYTADDPPVRYLLEALRRDIDSGDGLYAFQGGTQTDAQSRWLHKGVQPIVYEDGDNHKALWESLAAWAVRARDSEAWHQSIIAAALGGPATLAPHERGQVVHLVTTLEGARKVASAEKLLPAEWLCVFDRSVRFSRPSRVFDSDQEESFVDPFNAYGLDSDPVPSRIEPEEHFAKRDVPSDAWHGFQLTRTDRQSLTPNHIASLTGPWARYAPRLPGRLEQLGIWISRVSDQPAAVWWAAAQSGLHPDTQRLISYQLQRSQKPNSAEFRRAWQALFEAWETPKRDIRRDWFELQAMLALDGWSKTGVRHFAEAHRPYLTARRPIGAAPKPLEDGATIALRDMMSIDVEYPHIDDKADVPDAYLAPAVREWRKNLEHAVLLEKDLGDYILDHLATFEPDSTVSPGTGPQQLHGVSAHVMFFVRLMRRLIAMDVNAARQELGSWWSDDDTIFARLRIWSCANPGLVTPDQAAALLFQLSDRAFWNRNHQRDLLLVLAKRWSELSAKARARLKTRLLAGPARWLQEEDKAYARRHASATLERILWLQSQGCEFDSNIVTEIAQLRPLAPEWKDDFAQGAAESMDTRSGWVQTDSEYAALLAIPLDQVLTRAQELSGMRDLRFVEKDPFAGLVAAKPVRAFSALTLASKRGDLSPWAWKTFLVAEARKHDRLRFVSVVAERISRLPTSLVGELEYAITEWLMRISDGQLFQLPKAFELVWAKLIAALRERSAIGASTIVRQKVSPEWATEALNSPAGKLAQVVMNDPQTAELKKMGEGLPPSWRQYTEDLLSLGGDPHRHALTIFSYHLDWFFAIDPSWTEKHLLSALSSRDENSNALWAGFLWAARTPRRALFMRLKPVLLSLEREEWVTRHSHLEVLGAIILAAWIDSTSSQGEGLITDDEMRAVLVSASDEFRAQVLWQLERWSEEKDENRTWPKRARSFLTNVWPRHKAAKTSKTSARLCELACSTTEMFEETADIVTELATPIEQADVALFRLTDSPETIVDRYPDRTLALLWTVLSADVSKWPYRIETVLDRIAKADLGLLKDGRLVELRRRWDSR